MSSTRSWEMKKVLFIIEDLRDNKLEIMMQAFTVVPKCDVERHQQL